MVSIPGWQRYGLAVVLVLFAAAARHALDPILGDLFPFPLFLLGLMLAGWKCGLGPSIVCLILSWLAACVLFVPPRGSLPGLGIPHLMGSVMFLIVGTPVVLIFARVHAAQRLSEEQARELARAEEAQRREKRLYMAILNSMAEGVVAYDQEGRVILGNRGLERMLGPGDPERSLADVLDRLELFHPDGATPIHPEDLPIPRALRGEATDEREIVLRRPGSREARAITKTARPLLDDQGGVQGAIAIIRDITSQKLTEAEVRAGHERFQRFIDQIPIVTWIKDEDGRFLHVNRAYARLFGVSADRIIGKTSRDLFPAEEAERHRAEDRTVLASNEPLRIEEAVTLPDGSRTEYLTYKFALPGSGEQRQVAGAAVEVTELRRAERALRETDERLDFALQTSHVGAWELDLIDHSAFRSPEHDRIFGYETLLARWSYEVFLEHVLPEDRTLVDEKYRKAIATRADWNFECRIRRVDGAVRWIWAAGRPRVDEDGVPRRMAGIVQDITERKKAEAALAESEARFQAFMDHSPVLAWIKDEDGRFVYANRRFLTDFQIRAEDLIGRGDSDFWPLEIAKTYRSADRGAVEAGGPVEAVERFPVRDEDRTWWKIKFPMATSDGRTLVGGIGIDLTARIRAEQALAESEARFRNVLDRSPTIVYIKDLRRRYRFVNRRCAELWGTDPHDWVGRTAEELIPASTAEQFRLHDQRVLERGESFTVEEAFVTPGGEARTYLSTQFPLRDVQGTIISICGISLDITDRKRAEQAVLESEARFQAFMDNSPAAAWIKDEDGRVVYYNHMVLRGLSLQLEDVVGRPESELFPACAGEIRENDLRVLESGVPEQVIEHVELSAGHRRTMLNVKFTIPRGNGKRLIGGVGVDITERVQAEEALRTLNAELERRVAERAAEMAKLVTILDASTDFIATANPRGETIWANRAITKALGGHGPEGNIARIRDGHPPESARKVVEEGLPTAARDGHWLGETELLTPDGTVIPVSQLIMVHRDEEGRPAFFSTIMRDITGQKRLEQSLRERSEALSRLNDELVRASRMKDEFLANMSHELRTPLTGILGLSESLLEGVYGPLNGGQRQGISDIQECGIHLLALINDILDVAKIEAGRAVLELEEVELEPICRASERFVKEAAQKKAISVEFSMAGELRTLIADQRRLKQVLVNLLSNAVKFTNRGGKVGLDVTADPELREVRLAVWDTGIGISPEGLSLLFRPFVQLDAGLARHHGGTGLGLVLVKKLTELHGGTLRVESEPGRGSRFTVVLPWKAANQPSVDPPAADDPEAAGPNVVATATAAVAPRVLIVDDELVSVRALRDLLRFRGYSVEVAPDGASGIEMARSLRPDLIVMDIQMPGMDGIEAIRRVRAMPGLADVPILTLTAMAMKGDRERLLDAGATDYFSKPASIVDLSQRIHELLIHDRDGGTASTSRPLNPSG